MKNLLKVLFLGISIYCMPLLASAQANPGGDVDVPIDGGLSLLVAAGVGYAVKKGYTSPKKKNLSAVVK